MSDFNKFEKDLIGKFDEHHLEKDYNHLWGKLEPTLPKRRRRYFFILFFGFAMILLTGLLILEDVFNSDSQSLTVPQKEGINLRNADEGNLMNTAKIKQDRIEKEYDKPQVVKRHSNTITSKDEQPILYHEKSVFNKVDPSTLDDVFINNSISNLSSTNLRQTNFIKTLEDSMVVKSNSKVDLTNDTEEDKIVSTLNLKQITRLQPKIDYNSELIITKDQIVFHQKEESNKTEALFSFGMELLGGSFLDRGRASIEYGYLQEYISPLVSLDFGVSTSYRLSSVLQVGMSLNVSRITEKYEYKNELSSDEIVINEEAFLVNGVYLSAMQEVNLNKAVDVLKYNDLTILSLNPNVKVYPFRGRKLGIELGSSFVLLQRYQGLLLDRNLNLSKSGPLINSRKLTSFNPSLTVSYPINWSNFKANLLTKYQYNSLSSGVQRNQFLLGFGIDL